jgi:hypothetical protein
MNLEQLLSEIRQQRLILTWSRRGLVLWAPNMYVPAATRRAIVAHREELIHLVETADVRLCASPDIHRHSWQHAGGQRYACQICARLNVAIRQRNVA